VTGPAPTGPAPTGPTAPTGAGPQPETRLRPAPAFRPDRVYLGWQHVLTCPEPGPPPRQPATVPAARVSAAWLAAQRREEARLAGPQKLAGVCCAVLGCVVAAGWLAGVLNAGLTVLAGGACLAAGAASGRVIWRGERQLRDQVTAEERRVAEFRAAAERQQAARQAEHARQVVGWQQRSAAFRRQPQWYPVWLPGGIHRVDVAGGTLAGWSALLTSVAAPRLAAGGEVTVLDLTEGAVAGDLLALARSCGIDPLVWVLPADLPRLDLGAGLTADALADVLAATVSASDGQGSVADPSRDAALLVRVLAVLGNGDGDGDGGAAGIGQLTAALRALAQVGDPRDDVRAGLLTTGQLDRLTGLFGRGATDRVVIDRAWAMEARLRVLERLGSVPVSLPPSRLRLAWLDRRAAAVGNEVLGSYLTVALTHVLRQAPAGRPWQQTIFVLGAERLRPEVLDRLADACEVSRAGLVMGYRSIPAHVRDRLGRGNAAVAFMRLGNAQDARAAAEQLGTEHRFVVSQLTQTIGTSVTGTTGDSYTSTVGTADSATDSASVTDTTGASRGRGRSHGGRLASFAPFGDVTDSASRDRSSSRARSDSVSITEGINSSTAWGWSTSQAIGANESLARGAQRSREFLIEQHELQQLPQSAVLLTYAGPAGRRVVLADANPAIIGLPTAALVSLDEARAAAGAARPAAGPAGT
jgi:hypothetical protein